MLSISLAVGLGLASYAAASPAPAAAATATTTCAAYATLITGTPTATPKAANLPVRSTWEYPLGYNANVANANSSVYFYSVDLFNTSPKDIQALVQAGHFVACYFSAGSTESDRPDTNCFPKAAIGKKMQGWPEYWVDTRDATIRYMMSKRIQYARQQGCQGIDPDNIDGYDNESGFPLTQQDGIGFVQYMQNEAKKQGLKYGLKNGGDIISNVISGSDWVINEECVGNNECQLYKPFITAGKPVYHVEYTEEDDATSVSSADYKNWCGSGGQANFSTIIKHSTLDKWRLACPGQ